MSKPPLGTTTNSTQSMTPPAAAEPGPDWPVAKELWGIAWEFHWAGLGTLFSILAVRSFLVLAQVRTRQGFGRKPLFIAINSLLFTLGTTRALFLFLDPYSSAENGIEIPPWISMLVFGITYPCLTSSFCLIHLAFIEVAKIQLGSKRLQDVRFLGGIIGIHFAIVITAGATTALKPDSASLLLIICQLFFILWSLILSASFIYSGLKVINQASRVQKQIESIELGNSTIRRTSKRPRKTSKVAKVTLVTSVLGFVCCGLQIYSMFGVYGLYSKVVNPSPWPWWVFQTCFRLVEFGMACALAYSVTQPVKPGKLVPKLRI
ncbi:unnamed protein product [Porites lobata]|uniref:Proline-rich transmembrane protein 3/4 domain-containing protein n=1 Tax=Porites lobata TaxID=104759 RepID=A0ABN8P959_9CNID|nr:unnamed protein product [Porites lobata]